MAHRASAAPAPSPPPTTAAVTWFFPPTTPTLASRSRARSNRRSASPPAGHRNEHDPRDAAGQLQCPAHPDRSARRGRFLQRRQSARRKQSAGALQRDRDERAEYQRRELQLHRPRPLDHRRRRLPERRNHHLDRKRDQCRDRRRARSDRNLRHQLLDDPNPPGFREEHDQPLQTGASNLVLADQNQESANLLTLQTQQQLEISALSIANQANQSVLKLFP